MSSKKQAFTTPAGTAVYPWLNVPDTQFDSAGQYKVKLRMKKDDAKPLIDAVRQAANDAFGDKAKSAKLPFQNDPETGDVIMAAKSKFKPQLVDSTGAVIPQGNEPQIFGGSELKLAGVMYNYNSGGNIGISMQLGGVQVINLAERSGGGGAISFEPVSDGFVASNDNEPSDSDGGDYNF